MHKEIPSVSDLVVTVSEFSRSRIESIFKTPESRLCICYNGISDVFQNAAEPSCDVKQKYDLPEKYILCLSTVEPRKNMSLLIKAFDSLKKKNLINSDLVIVGRKGWKLEQAVGDASLLTDNVHFTGFVEDSDLPFIYRNANYFVFPSLYEGFGIPVIEAMSQGTVVVSSDATSLPEVAGDAAVYFESNSLQALEASMVCVENMSVAEKESYIRKGIAQSERFNWDNEAGKLYGTLRDRMKG